MHTDRENRFRPHLRRSQPDFSDRVNTAFDQLPDLPDFNRAAYEEIEYTLDMLEVSRARARLQNEPLPMNSKGVLVLGEAGSGKTHLLMRVAQKRSTRTTSCSSPARPVGPTSPSTFGHI